MVRKYLKMVGPSRRQNYEFTAMIRAQAAVRRGMSIRAAAEKFGVPNSTLGNKVKGILQGKYGGQTALTSEEEEEKLVHCILTCARWRIPLQMMDIWLVVKGFLDRAGKTVKCFKANMPGKEWVLSFLCRNYQLAVRIAQNLKSARAALSGETVKDYFVHLTESVQDVSPQCIINYDETNFTDDPGAVKVVCKKGVRRIERLRDHSKMEVMILEVNRGQILQKLNGTLERRGGVFFSSLQQQSDGVE